VRHAVFFVFSKLVFALIAPSNLCLLLMGGGLVMARFQRWRRAGSRLVVGGFLALLVIGFSPVGKWLTLPLEERFAEARLPEDAGLTHIIFLGGFEKAAIGQARGQMSTNAAAERLLETVTLARRYPASKVVFTGGYGWLIGAPVSATQSVSGYLERAGIEPDRIVVEGRSRNTWENAAFVREVIEREGAQCPCRFALVTSASHMPRAMGVFRKAGFDADGRTLYPVPVDYRTRGGGDVFNPYFWMHEGVEQTDLAFKEWVGLLAYFLSGRTDELWPGPEGAGTAAVDDLKKGS
jgi:uncharacterized SAM-binding protein YcdF (DUF218 family)